MDLAHEINQKDRNIYLTHITTAIGFNILTGINDATIILFIYS